MRHMLCATRVAYYIADRSAHSSTWRMNAQHQGASKRRCTACSTQGMHVKNDEKQGKRSTRGTHVKNSEKWGKQIPISFAFVRDHFREASTALHHYCLTAHLLFKKIAPLIGVTGLALKENTGDKHSPHYALVNNKVTTTHRLRNGKNANSPNSPTKSVTLQPWRSKCFIPIRCLYVPTHTTTKMAPTPPGNHRTSTEYGYQAGGTTQ